ncbi:MAG: methionine biosynthesis protein MetW [Victivallales bacterium]|nr:methionine biosynthesis protein MetW [Victivallales bacterium]
MVEFTGKHKESYLKTLEHFGVNGNDCTFESLKECALHLQADLPEKGVARWHDTIVQNLIRPGQSVIDLGCGDGELLYMLSQKNNCWIQGIETDEVKVNHCIERGVPVCHGDLSEVMRLLPDNSYDWAVLENTIQTLRSPMQVLDEMLRISKHSIVSFPNFAHWSVRFTFSLGGRMPVTKSLPYKWYNTPNIHLCSITDFLDWVDETKIHILNAWVLVEGNVVPFTRDSDQNIMGEQALFVIEK